MEADVDGAISRARALSLTFKLKENLKDDILADWDMQFRATVSCILSNLIYLFFYL